MGCGVREACIGGRWATTASTGRWEVISRRLVRLVGDVRWVLGVGGQLVSSRLSPLTSRRTSCLLLLATCLSLFASRLLPLSSSPPTPSLVALISHLSPLAAHPSPLTSLRLPLTTPLHPALYHLPIPPPAIAPSAPSNWPSLIELPTSMSTPYPALRCPPSTAHPAPPTSAPTRPVVWRPPTATRGGSPGAGTLSAMPSAAWAP